MATEERFISKILQTPFGLAGDSTYIYSHIIDNLSAFPYYLIMADESPNSPSKEEPGFSRGERSWLKAISFVEVGLLEIFFAAVALILFFGILNYFNVLPLSRTFPTLSFLPHQQQNKPKLLQPPRTMTTLIAEKGTADLTKFIRINLVTAPDPKGIKVDFVRNNKGQILDPNRMVFNWSDSSYQGNATIRYNNQLNIEDKSILLILPNIVGNPSAFEPTITTDYFNIKPEGKWNCQDIVVDNKNTKSTICENFWRDKNDIKRGIGLMSPIPGEDKAEIFTCEIYSNSQNYNWDTCSTQKATAKGV